MHDNAKWVQGNEKETESVGHPWCSQISRHQAGFVAGSASGAQSLPEPSFPSLPFALGDGDRDADFFSALALSAGERERLRLLLLLLDFLSLLA